MRRPGLIAALAALLLLLAMPAPMQAVRHSFQAPQVVSVSITAAGGTWPYCRQTATVEFATGHIPGYLWVTPYLDGGLTASYYARIRGDGTIDIPMAGVDYSQTSTAEPAGWAWLLGTASRRAPGGSQAMTTFYDFAGSCPAPGVLLATGPEPLPWP